MLVQALAEYADTYLAHELNGAAWESKPVPWLLEFGHTWRVRDFRDHLIAASLKRRASLARL